MRRRWIVFVFAFLAVPGMGLAEIISSTDYALDLTKGKAAPKAEWADPDRIKVTDEGLGWGKSAEEGSRDFWLQTEPIGIGTSWRPTSITTVKATIEGTGSDGLLYARYSADGKHWTTWQQLDSKGKGTFQGTLRVPYRESKRYHELRLDYARRADVDWGSDEEALARDILKREPTFFAKSTPFIGYVQFLYETQLRGGQRIKALKVNADWWLSGLHHPPRKAGADKDRDIPWRFKAP
jgi:hypothetical protein